nr:hypothetical protein [Tanacetum cinerariifolium]
DDDEEDVDTDYSKGDEVDADDSNADDGILSDMGLQFLLRLQQFAADDDEEDVDTDYSEGDEVDADDSNVDDATFSDELFQEHDDDDNEGEDIDMYEELNMSNLPAL